MHWSGCYDLLWPWRHWRQVRGEAIALRLNDEQLNWRELCARVDELASGFAAQGVVEGSGVMLRAWNTPQTLLAWLALLQCGARVLPVNPQLPQPLLEELLPNLTLQFALVPEPLSILIRPILPVRKVCYR